MGDLRAAVFASYVLLQQAFVFILEASTLRVEPTASAEHLSLSATSKHNHANTCTFDRDDI